MNEGRTVVAQLLGFLPQYEFASVSPVTTATAASANLADLAAYAALSLLNLACPLLNRQIAAQSEFLKTKAVSRSGLAACAARGENKADSFQPLWLYMPRRCRYPMACSD